MRQASGHDPPPERTWLVLFSNHQIASTIASFVARSFLQRNVCNLWRDGGFAVGAVLSGLVADAYGIRPHVRLDREVTERTWDDAQRLWRLRAGGRTVSARYVISAIGA